MSQMVIYLMLGCVMGSLAAPAYAGAISREPLTQAEDTALAAQQMQDAGELAEIAAGDGIVVVLAVVGLLAIILYATGVIE